ncbi:hypothetical protein K2X40_02035 [Candidatus Babeliales bacterium]|nr:hypothetical protein [Candidatus Babeliales bacterium]
MFKFKKLDFSPGQVTYDDFDINPDIAFEEQQYSLDEDLFQVSYGEEYTIDIGWSPSSDPEGNFVVRIIKNYDWDTPLYQKQTNNFEVLDESVAECAKMVKNLLNEQL